MNVVEDGMMLPNGQAQGSSGLNSNPTKAEANLCEDFSLNWYH